MLGYVHGTLELSQGESGTVGAGQEVHVASYGGVLLGHHALFPVNRKWPTMQYQWENPYMNILFICTFSTCVYLS